MLLVNEAELAPTRCGRRKRDPRGRLIRRLLGLPLLPRLEDGLGDRRGLLTGPLGLRRSNRRRDLVLDNVVGVDFGVALG